MKGGDSVIVRLDYEAREVPGVVREVYGDRVSVAVVDDANHVTRVGRRIFDVETDAASVRLAEQLTGGAT